MSIVVLIWSIVVLKGCQRNLIVKIERAYADNEKSRVKIIIIFQIAKFRGQYSVKLTKYDNVSGFSSFIKWVHPSISKNRSRCISVPFLIFHLERFENTIIIFKFVAR